MSYKSFKEYIEINYGAQLQEQVTQYVKKHHDGQGFHSLNVLSLLDQKIENLQVMSLSCRRDVGPRIEIDVHVKALIVTKGLGTRDYNADQKTRWFTVYMKAVLKDGLHEVEFSGTDEYYGGKFDIENALDTYLVPYLSTDQLEDVADDFTQFYCSEEAYDGTESPLKTLLRELDLMWYLSDLPQGEMGRMYFRDKEEDYEIWYQSEPGRMVPRIEKVHDIVPRGAMLISKSHYFMNGYGSRADTIAHEIVHWDKHDLFFEVLALLNEDERSLYCEATPVGSPDGLEGIAKARWWAEWQANALAPRYLMPRWVFNKIFSEMLEKYVGDDYLTRGQVMECAIGDTARYFQVSVYEVKLRALQLGYKEAEGTYLRYKGRDQEPFSFNQEALEDYQTFILDGKNGGRLYWEDSRFKELIDTEQFVYIGCVVCVNHPLYVCKTDDPAYPRGYVLTDYAREHVDLCCLKFNRHYSREDRMYEYYDACYLSKEVNVEDFKEARDIDYTVNKEILIEQQNLKGYEDESERLAAILATLPPTFWGTFDAHMNRLKKEKKLTNLEMEMRTGYSERHIRALRKGDENVQRDTVYALCIGMHLHPYLSDDFVRKGGGYPFTKEGMYYRTLIERHYMEPLSYINNKLKARGYKPWGVEDKILDLNEKAE